MKQIKKILYDKTFQKSPYLYLKINFFDKNLKNCITFFPKMTKKDLVFQFYPFEKSQFKTFKLAFFKRGKKCDCCKKYLE
ncbi:hypothetical protein BpHYR1_006969 [Brachionus plicatilis]|uniref:Uncharacterized protein n=1 Tax=Brachionus plicatilis TaxID=10195 RepID=A0A3M7RG57_BRAPC|nr:hypothetical protein BpHYR1_006969 [Brachionus plicatilis]